MLEREDHGYFSGASTIARAGTLYRYRMDRGERLFPDPASRFQPEGPHGPSEIVNPFRYHWKDSSWKGARIEGQVIYEMHIGTFTQEGTWDSARELLPELAHLGITLIEVMPVAEFPGQFGWGYDGVSLFAPYHIYGTPDAFRAFVDRAHALSLGVILDVVYNHVGPDGNYLKEFSKAYFTKRYENEWGEAINFDGSDSIPVREFFASNACYWIDEFHLDGLRLDATQQIFDASPENILRYITRQSRDAAGLRSIVVIAENESQQAGIAQPPEEGGFGLDGLWNDDFHHSTRVALTGRNEAYYSDYCGRPQELISAAKWGFLYQGQYYSWQRKRRGTSALGLRPAAFVNYIQNHDQIANSAYGLRAQDLTTFGRYKAVTALLLLTPGTPLLFQGQEYCASTPFMYFADHHAELAKLVQQGRAEFLSQFPCIAEAQKELSLAAPHDRATFERCKLNRDERRRNADMLLLHSDLLKMRREDPVFSAQRSDGLHGAVLGPEALALRFFGGVAGDRLLIVNLGRDLHLQPVPEPLLAPPENGAWQLVWSSEDPKYRGSGQPGLDDAGPWTVPGHSALVMYERSGD